MPHVREPYRPLLRSGAPGRTAKGTPEAATIGHLAPLRPGDVVSLQRLAGNKAVTGLLERRSASTGGLLPVQRRGKGGETTTEETGTGDAKEAKDKKKKRGLWGKVKSNFKKFFGKADASEIEAERMEDADSINAMTKEEQLTSAQQTAGSLDGATPDYVNPEVRDEEPDRWSVTLAAAQEDPAWLQNVKELKSAAIRSVISEPKVMVSAIKGGTAEEYMGRKVLEARGSLEGKSESDQEAAIKTFTKGLHKVGHTWVRLASYVGNKLHSLYSYGMWPQKLYVPEGDDTFGGYAGFEKPGPGQIRHPDTVHEADSNKAYLDYQISAKQFASGLRRADQLFRSPPPYVLVGYNCTAFAREILQKTGQSYPGAGLLPGFAYTPGNLYHAIMKKVTAGKEGASTTDIHEDVVKKVNEETERRAQSGEDEAYWKMLGRPKDDAPRVKVQMKKFASLEYGDHPRRVTEFDNTENLFKGNETTYVDDQAWISQTNLVPVEVGGRMLYFSAGRFMSAVKKDKDKAKSSDSSTSPSGKLTAYLANDGNLMAWEEIDRSALSGVQLTSHTDVDSVAPDWYAANKGVEMLEILWKGSSFWVKKSEWEAMQSVGSESAPSGPMLQLYKITPDKNLAQAEAVPAGTMLRPSGFTQQDSAFLMQRWIDEHPGVVLVGLMLAGEERWAVRSEFDDFLSKPSGSPVTGPPSVVHDDQSESPEVRSRSVSVSEDESSSEGPRSRSSSFSDEDYDEDSPGHEEQPEDPGQAELHRFSSEAMLMLKHGQDISMAEFYTQPSDFTSLSPEGRAALARHMGIEVKDLDDQIAGL